MSQKIIVAQIFQNSEKNTIACDTPEDARKAIAEGNATAAQGWRWGLSQTNWTDDDGVPLTIDEANEIRAAVGVSLY